MSSAPEFDTAMMFDYGVPSTLYPGIQRLVANNPSVFTFKGTNTYILGTDTLAIIDPGPADEAHLAAILAAVGGRPVSHIVVTHTHRDHVDLLPRLQDVTRARTCGFGRQFLPRPGHLTSPSGSEFVDLDFRPDVPVTDGDVIEGDGWQLAAIHTPGHAPDHLCFALTGRDLLFSGDHVMAWNTTVVAPPEGNMGDFLRSLERLVATGSRSFLPGHGGEVREPDRMVRALLVHRRWREQAIFQAIEDGYTTIQSVVSVVYAGLDPRLSMAAKLSVQAHVEHLASRDLVTWSSPLTFDRPLSIVSAQRTSPPAP